MKRLNLKSNKLSLRLNTMVINKDGSTDQSGYLDIGDGRVAPYHRGVEAKSIKFKISKKLKKHLNGKAL